MAIQWIDEPCPGPGGVPPGWSTAEAFYGAGVIPPTTKPPWLHDSGGVGPGIIAGAPDQIGVGQGQSVQAWEFRFYDANDYLVYAMPGYRALSYAQGVETLRQAYMNSASRGVAKVCAVARSQYGGARLCYTSYGLRTQTDSPTWNGTRGCRPGTALRQDGWCVQTFAYQPKPITPTLQPIPPSLHFMYGPRGFVGQTCDEIQAHINELQNARAQLSKDLENASAGYNAAIKAYSALVAAGQDATAAGDAVNAASAQVADIKTNIQNIDAEIVKSKAGLAACQGGAQPGPTGCTDDSNCPAGFSCIEGNCILTGCRNDGDCGTFKCVKANPNDEFGTCQPPPPVKAGISGGGAWALALLGLAAVGAIFFGARPGGGPAELDELV